MKYALRKFNFCQILYKFYINKKYMYMYFDNENDLNYKRYEICMAI